MLEGWLTRAFATDILWSLADLANWHTLASGATYGAAGIDSPVLHFWSLAIEEQCYLVLPLVVWAVMRWRGWSLRTLGRVVLVMLLASLAYTAVHHGNADLIYLSTFSRVAELLIGVLLAVVFAQRGTLPSDRAWPVVGFIALGGLLAVMATTSLDAPIYARGGLVVAALLAALALMGAVVDGPLARVLGVAPLRAIGRISYAVYLFHWPILMAFREAGIDAWYVAPITLAATFALATLSMAALEAPIRNRRRVLGAPRRLVLAVAVTIVVVCTFGVAPASTDLDFATAQAEFDDLGASAPALSGALTDDGSPADSSDPLAQLATPTTDLPGPTGPPATIAHPTVMMFGDSTALMLGLGLIYTDALLEVPGFANVGCPITRGGSFRLNFADDSSGKVFPAGKSCDWTKKLPELAGKSHPQLAVFSGGLIDSVPRKITALGPGWHTVDEPPFQDHMRSELDAAVDAVVAHVAVDQGRAADDFAGLEAGRRAPPGPDGHHQRHHPTGGRRPAGRHRGRRPQGVDRRHRRARAVVSRRPAPGARHDGQGSLRPVPRPEAPADRGRAVAGPPLSGRALRPRPLRPRAAGRRTRSPARSPRARPWPGRRRRTAAGGRTPP